MEIDDRLKTVFASIFDLDPAAVSDSDSPQTIEAWDSVHHLQLIMAVEGEFGIQFDPDHMADLTSFAAFQEKIRANLT